MITAAIKHKLPYRKLAFIMLLVSQLLNSVGQECPANIDFETGTFNGWTCYTGHVAAINGQNQISFSTPGGAMPNRHTMFNALDVAGYDEFGGFPVNCPNGSGHSIKLGNTTGGGEAEGIAYEFTIPASEEVYNLIYHYAVVFQDPNHEEYQQPRMQIEVINVTDNKVIECSSFAFHPYGTPLPGFKLSPNPGTETPVWYKDWTAVSVNLDGHAGKRIKLLFKTADCTFRRHFGYAYIDVNSECSGTFVGANYCKDDTAVNIVAPYGYQTYTWYDQNFNQVLGRNQVLTMKPPPLAGTTIAVKLEPYNGYGCPRTLYARLMDTLSIRSNAGADLISCNRNQVQLGALPKPGLIYRWRPSIGLSNPNISNPLATPDTTTTYILSTWHDGGGCIDNDTVVVHASKIDNTIQLLGNSDLCIGTGDSAVLKVKHTNRIQWFRNDVAIPGATNPAFRVQQSGLYHASLSNNDGCNLLTSGKEIDIASIPSAEISSTATEKCLSENKFVFTNSSTNQLGPMEYTWMMGDGSVRTSKEVTHTYTKAGKYEVLMIAKSNAICADTARIPVEVYPNAIADFEVKPVCVDIPVQPVNNTKYTGTSEVKYIWNLGNGFTSTDKIPPAQIYANPGTYPITLSVNTDQCPFPLHTVKRNLVIDKPKKAIKNPTQFAVINLPITLRSREFGEEVLWSPGTNLDTRTSYTPVFKGSSDQLYTIEIKTATGCVTVDTLLVKAVKEVKILVPNAFTPNNDSHNDFLKPILIGVKELRYFRIFNRWGQLIFEMNSEQPGWDGKVKGVQLGSQTVAWMLEGIGVDGKIYFSKGTTVLIR